MADSELRVLLVGPYPPPFGGIASHIINLIPALLARGARDVAVLSFGATDDEAQEHGATIHRVNAAQHLSRALRAPVTAAAALRDVAPWKLGLRRTAGEVVRALAISDVAARHRSNVLSCYQSNESIALLSVARRTKGRPGIVLTVFGEFYDTPEFFEPRRAPMGRLLDAADARLSSSRHCARSFQKIGLQQPVEAVYYGVDLDRFSGVDGRAFRRRHGIGETDVLVTYMGRFAPEMGIDSVLMAAPALLAREPSLRLLLAGARGPLLPAAERLTANSAGRVIVLKDIPFADQPQLYAATDVVLAPTRDQHACMGMSIKEAMASGCAVIATAAGGIPEAVVDGETGILVPLASDLNADSMALQQAVIRLASDAGSRRRMGLAGRARAETLFSNDRTADRIYQVFQSVRPR